jgi:hypothetical protein
MWSGGTADISSQSFDGGNPMAFELGAPILEIIPESTPQHPNIVLGSAAQLELRPALLRKGSQTHIQVIITAQPPSVSLIPDAVGETGRVIQASRKLFQITR